MCIAEHRKTFLEAQLEPVSAGHPVARPVVKILVANDGFDPFVRRVDRGIGRSEHARRVEYIEPLVLHGSHVESFHSDDHEDVEIVFTTEHLLVPTHCPFQRTHCVFTLVDIVRLRVNSKFYLPPIEGGERIRHEG